MLHIVLYQPEIPPNTGNVIRLAANAGAALHLIRPLGFEMNHAKLRRAGLDYHEYATLQIHDNFDAFLALIQPKMLYAFTTKGTRAHSDVTYADGDALVFGSETRGLPSEFLAALPASQRLCLPMVPGGRSLNLSNAVAISVYEAWRQLGFAGRR